MPRKVATLLAGLVLAPGIAAAAPLGDITIADTAVFPENIAAGKDGTVYFGSVAKGAIYRAAPGATTAAVWIPAGTAGMTASMGMWVDARRGLFWACAPGARATETTPAGPSFIKTFDLKTGAPKASYGFEGGGRCNDLTIVADGTVYATDFSGGRVLRLKAGDDRFRPWAADPGFVAPDGLALLGDGALYVNTYRTGMLFKVPVNKDGTAGTPVRIATDRELVKPDGMRAVGPQTLLVVEGEGRLSELTIADGAAKVRVVRDGFADSPVGVALVKGTAFVTQAKWAAMADKTKDPGSFGAVAVPYSLAK